MNAILLVAELLVIAAVVISLTAYECRHAPRISRSRSTTGAAFWREFRRYWSPDAIAARLDDFTARLETRGRRDPK